LAQESLLHREPDSQFRSLSFAHHPDQVNDRVIRDDSFADAVDRGCAGNVASNSCRRENGWKEDLISCPKCGSDLADPSRYCPRCGQAQGVVSVGGGAAAAVAPARIPEPKPKPKPKPSHAIRSGIGLMLLLTLLVASWYMQAKTSSSLQEKQAEQVSQPE